MTGSSAPWASAVSAERSGLSSSEQTQVETGGFFFTDTAAAVRQANVSIYGLQVGVWASDLNKMHGVTRMPGNNLGAPLCNKK
jgi:hypothetical protein